ncbi:MAG TPA: DUF6174 domain-containing protein [Pirellulaceae bacterium]|jgi:hypothetical protein
MIDRAPNADVTKNGDDAARRALPVMGAARRFVAFTLLGIGAGLIVMLVVMRQANYDPAPSLSPEEFHAAYEHWKAHKISSYDIEVKVTGPQAAIYRVEVRDGEAIAARRNGQLLMSQRTFGTWSIPGMFSTISRDVEAIERAAAEHKQRPLILRAAFNAEYGYPERYRRIDNGSRKGGDSMAVTWDVVEFRVVEAAETKE